MRRLYALSKRRCRRVGRGSPPAGRSRVHVLARGGAIREHSTSPCSPVSIARPPLYVHSTITFTASTTLRGSPLATACKDSWIFSLRNSWVRFTTNYTPSQTATAATMDVHLYVYDLSQVCRSLIFVAHGVSQQ